MMSASLLGRSQVNTVVVGYGFAGKKFHCPLVRATSGLVLYGVVARDQDTQKQAQQDHGDLKTFNVLEEALTDAEVDLIILATPSSTHASMAIAALQGLVVFLPSQINLTLENSQQAFFPSLSLSLCCTILQQRNT